ncbi:MAG: DUF2249 domain-containing protein [Rhodospirillales bacterium]|jgi:hypothetical protein|nr:hypothetical protein [Rhodospirillaceae bacterium]MDP6429105.1 DUF2249 domain-containing protein [Rhodospirillales bacterium]MDP6645711.1 DUF2249 domain-containing protein [Rhodospirillales bacterium]|tara:strand:+ start:757 stop:1014 length:258 start_codon:yes stop_codon:yes gene_type:complete
MAKRWREADGVHLDLTGLEPPAPLLAVMEEVSGSDEPLILHINREPIFLYPELEELGWTWTARKVQNPAPGEAAFVIQLKKAVTN